ncbi:MAG TPA: sigma-54 dependent transcriptional regulator [Thermodesulfobacteriota bacterium]|nr:sigma-54 dependent transcriptional regulator [Thermodesulfobacteriota bacterium]
MAQVPASSNNEKILIVEDDDKMLGLLRKVLARHGFSVTTCIRGWEALEKAGQDVYDLVISDIRMPGMTGLDLLKSIRSLSPDTYVILMTAFGSVDSAVASMKQGAYDYITKPFKMDEFVILVRKALEEQKLRQEVKTLRAEVQHKYSFGNIIGKSQPMQEVYTLIKRVAFHKTTVLITGQSGTGKELVAKAIHYNSPRSDFPFVVVNCSAIPETLLESELFGHVQGAFTGAISSRKGLFEEAERGSVFLDEVGNIPPSIQVKLLRVLQEREIRRLGGAENIKVDVRLIAATNVDLYEEVRKGQFRDDLYYRLNVVHINLPSLRDRPEDIPLLIQHFLNKYSHEYGVGEKQLSKEALRILMDYEWPGNVRELENCIERAVTLGRHEIIKPEDLPSHLANAAHESVQVPELPENLTLKELEIEYIRKILTKTGGNKVKAAAILGINRRTIYRLAQQYKIDL